MSDSKGAAIRDEILKLFGAYLESGKWTIPPEKVADQILAILAQEVKRVIGEDEKITADTLATDVKHTRNELRAIQRRKAGLV